MPHKAITSFFLFALSTVLFCSNAFCEFNVTITNGQANQSKSGLESTITQSAPGNLIAAGNLSTVTGESVKIILMSPSDFTLLRDVTGNPTLAYGSYFSNGGLFMVNPQGFIFGPNSVVNAPSIVVSTLNISDSDFLSGAATGKFHFSGQGSYIINQGQFIPKPGGYVALLSGAIRNEGTIQARLGQIVLASGDDMTLTTVALDDANTIFVVIDKGVESEILGPNGNKINDAIENKGLISADGGTITLTAKSLNTIFDHSINNSGIIEAKAIDTTKSGDVVLKAQGAIESTGTLKTDSLFERGASFDVGGIYSVGHADIKNADNAMTFSADTDVTGSITDAANIIIDPNITLTMTGDTSFTAGDSFLMDPTATINGGGHNLDILAMNDANVGNINNVSGLNVTATAGNLTLAGALATNGGNITLTAGQDIIQESSIKTNGGNFNAFASTYIFTGNPSISTGSGIATIVSPTIAEIGLGGSNTATSYNWTYLGSVTRGYSLIQFGYYINLGGQTIYVPFDYVGLTGDIRDNPGFSGTETLVNINGGGEYVLVNSNPGSNDPSGINYWYSDNALNNDGQANHVNTVLAAQEAAYLAQAQHGSITSYPNQLSEFGVTNFTDVVAVSNPAGSVYNWDDQAKSISDFDFNDVIIQINPVQSNALIITPNNQSKTYGTALPSLTVNYAGFVNGDTSASLTTQPKVSTTATSASSVGTYSITASGAVDPNYTILYVPGSLSITPAQLTISGLIADPKVYDGTTSATISGSPNLVGVIPGDNVDLSGTPVGTFSNPNADASGTTTPVSISGYSLTGVDAGNYTLSQPTIVQGKITPAPLTVGGLSAAPKTYDGTTDATLNGSPVLNGVVPGENVVPVGTPIGTFNSPNVVGATSVDVTGISLGGTANLNNYTLTLPTTIPGSISPAPLTVIATGPTKAFGTALTAGPSTTNFTSAGTVHGESVTGVTLTPDANGLSASTPAGTDYVVTPSAATGSNGFISSNYNTTYIPFNGTVTTTVTPPVTPPTTPPTSPSFANFNLLQTNDKVNTIIYETLHPYQLSSNAYEPLIFFYHPLTPIDQSAFNGITLDEGAYDFIEHSLKLKTLPSAYYGK